MIDATTDTRHEYVGDDTICERCDLSPEAAIHTDPADDIPWDLADAIGETLEKLDELAIALQRAGGRDSDNPIIRRFCAYHLADIEGNDRGGGWLADNLLSDALRELGNQPVKR